MNLPQSDDIDSTTDIWNKSSLNEQRVVHDDENETPTINSTNPNYHPISPTTTTTHSWETSNPVVDSIAKGKTELKKRSTTGRRYYYKNKKSS